MKIIYMGTPNFSKIILEKLLNDNFKIELVVSKKDQKTGRKQLLTKSLVKQYAEKKGLNVLTPDKIKDIYTEIDKINPDIIITAAFGKMIPKYLLDKYHVINVHASLLPKYRGGAPIEWAMINKDKYTGISIMRLTEKMDQGPFYLQEKLKIDYEKTKTELTDMLAVLGYDLLKKYLLNPTKYPEIIQDEKKATYAYNISFEDQIISFNKPSDKVISHINAMQNEPGALFYHKNMLIKIISAKKCDIINKKKPGIIMLLKGRLLIGCNDSFIEILKIQEQGKKQMDIKTYLNGQRLFVNSEIICKEE